MFSFLRSKENTGYGAGGANTRKDNMKGFTAGSGSAHTDIDEHNARLRSNARVLYQISPIVTSAINTLCTDVIGCGLKPNPNVDYEFLHISPKAGAELNAKIKRLWKLFASDKRECDATGLNNFYDIEDLVFSSAKQSGDCFVLLKFFQRKNSSFGLKFHVLEADRISTPVNMLTYGSSSTQGKNPDNNNTIYDGVEVDSNGEIKAYWISKYHPDDEAEMNQEWERVEPYDDAGRPNILHIMKSERPDQYRGVPFAAKIIETGIGLKRYDDSTQLTATIGNYLSYWIKRNSPDSDLLPPDNAAPAEAKKRTDPDDILISPGCVNRLEEGEEVQSITPPQPTTAFPAYMESQYRIAGAATGQGGEKLLHSYNASYSASRATIEEAWKGALKERASFLGDFCEWAYELFFCECVARGYINAPGFFTNPLIRQAYLRSAWIGQSKVSLDPTKEITSALLALPEGVKTRQQITLELTGQDWEENIATIKRENEMLKEAGLLPEKNNGNENNGNNGGEDSGQKMIAMLQKFINLYEKEIQNEKSEKDNQEN